MRWRLGSLLALVMVGCTAAPALAFDPPQLWIARAATPSDRGTNPWMPLSGAQLTTGGEYRLGVTIQSTGSSDQRQYMLFQQATVPDPAAGGGFDTGGGGCSEVRGNPGDIADFGGDVYAGDGTYTIKVAIAGFVQGPCPASGVSTTGSFTVDARPTVQIVGAPVVNRPSRASVFQGVETALAGDTSLPAYECAHNPHVRLDGSLTGDVITQQRLGGTDAFDAHLAFPASGHWACVARAESTFNSNAFTSWSAPILATLPGVFMVNSFEADHRVAAPRAVLHLDTADAGEVGATVTLALHTCRRHTFGHARRRGPTVRATVDSHGIATFRFRLPDRPSQLPVYWLAQPRFSGTSYVRATTAPLLRIDDYIDSEVGRTLNVGAADRC